MPVASTPMSTPDTDSAVESDPLYVSDRPWRTIVWNDPVNLMSYVTYVFRSYFGYSEVAARALMLQVHHEGRAAVSSGTREKVEVDVQAMHSFGLWATLAQDGD